MPKPIVNTPIAPAMTPSANNNAYIAVLPLLDDRSADDGNGRVSPVHACTPREAPRHPDPTYL
jgi:hypothetical protein